MQTSLRRWVPLTRPLARTPCDSNLTSERLPLLLPPSTGVTATASCAVASGF
jgi:hypothetical protein